MRKLLCLLLAVAGAIGAGIARGRLEAPGAERAGSRPLLYLPNGRHLRLLSLGHAPSVADVLYLWAIQFYSDYQRADRYRYVEHVFGSVIAELDPHYVDPYWLGALILTVEARDLEAALRLLDRGFASNPRAWVLPYLAGWECARVGSFERAASYFERAASVPSAPPAVLRTRAGMVARGGDLRTAIRDWNEVIQDPRSDSASRAIAERQIRDLTVRADLRDLGEAIRAFRERNGSFPRALGDLVSSGLLRVVPLDPDGVPYRYDRTTGEVSSPAGRVLGDRS